MAKSPTATLRSARITEKIDECIAESFGTEWRKRDGIRPQTVADCFIKKHPELIANLGAEMAYRYITTIASNRLREGSAVLRAAKSKVMILPGLDETILANLPPLITVPTKGKGCKHKPITHATLGEVRAYYKLLNQQLENDKARFGAVEFLLTPLEGFSDALLVHKAWAEKRKMEEATA